MGKMDVVERKRSNGGFLNLFDWPGKSRKKLFSCSSDLSEEPKQGKENGGGTSKTRLHVQTELDDTRTNSSYNLRSDLSCASSVASDEGHGTKAPSVVARLMGLESLPVPNGLETRFNPGFDPFPHRQLYYANTWNGYECSGYVNCHSDVDGISSNRLESRMSTGHNRPIERFQTETLPPKSVKPISITHNRLLSPIRSPCFVPTKNPAYIMEAASRIIEPSPHVINRTRVSAVGPSLVPLRIRDLKEKLEPAHKASSSPQTPNNICKSQYSMGNHDEKRNRVSTAMAVAGKGLSGGLKGKGKPSSVSAQAKVNNIHKRGSLTSSVGNRKNSVSLEQRMDSKSRPVKSQSDMQKNSHKGNPANSSKTMLRQNNLKQNCANSQVAKTSAPNQQNKKVINKVVNKVRVESKTGFASKNLGSSAHAGNEDSLTRKKNLSRNRKSPNQFHGQRVSGDLQIRGEKSIKCNVAIDGDNPKKDMDVISFTFSSPIKGAYSDPQSSSRLKERDKESASCSFGATSSCMTSFNVVDGDSLNVLLEQKLRELACKIESSSCNIIREESLDSNWKELMPNADESNVIISVPSRNDKWLRNGSGDDLSETASVSDCAVFDDQPPQDFVRKFQIVQSEEAEEHDTGSMSTDAGIEADYRHISPILDIGHSCIIKSSLLAQEDQKELGWVSQPVEEESELSETASSTISIGAFTFLEPKEEQPNWELEYITDILNAGRLMLKEFALDMSQDVLPSSLFDEMDSQGNPIAKIERKTLFDCVSHCLAKKREQMFIGSCKGFGKHGILLKRKDWLAEEVYREIEGLKNMGEMMVDELVDKDMSSLDGKWIDYEKEAYEEGIEIEKVILSSMVDDLAWDLLCFRLPAEE